MSFLDFFRKRQADPQKRKEPIPPSKRIFSHDTLVNTFYQRFIALKGMNPDTANSKLQDFLSLGDAGISLKDFQMHSTASWVILKLPADIDHYTFHTLAYWFLGSPPDDDNCAEKIAAFGLSDVPVQSYVLHNNDLLQQLHGRSDTLFGEFANDEQFFLNIPFDEFETATNEYIGPFRRYYDEIFQNKSPGQISFYPFG